MKPINFAVAGAGGFAHFAVTQFVKIPGVQLTGVFDEISDNALRFKKIDNSVNINSSLEELYAARSIDLVYIATPPYLESTCAAKQFALCCKLNATVQ